MVEDDPNDVILLERALRRAGPDVTVHHVGCGERAVRYLEGEGEYADRVRFPLPQVVLLDLNLPRLDGFEVLDHLRQHPRLRRIPVVVLTSSREPRDVTRAYDLGARGYVVKPGRFRELQQLVEGLGRYWLDLNVAPHLDQ